MTSVTTIANKLNKDREYVLGLCDCYNIDVSYDPDGEWVRDDDDAKKLLEQEINVPTRYKRNGVECFDIQNIMCGGNNIQYSFLCNIIKYLFRRQNVGDLKKAYKYLGKWIEVIDGGDELIK